jgi:hypothetical protein
MENLPSDE